MTRVLWGDLGLCNVHRGRGGGVGRRLFTPILRVLFHLSDLGKLENTMVGGYFQRGILDLVKT